MTREASDIIVFRTVKGEVLFASEALERILGRTASEIDRGGFMNFIHPEDLEEARRISIVPAPGDSVTATYRVQHQDGRYLWLESVIRAIYDETTARCATSSPSAATSPPASCTNWKSRRRRNGPRRPTRPSPLPRQYEP